MSPTFRSLRVRNYRLFATGQVVSLTGTWGQRVAQDWLVLRLSHDSGVAIGVTTALQFLPMLLFGLWGGVLADRFDKRRLLVIGNVAMGASALALGVLDVSGVVQLWHVYVMAFVLGLASVLDAPVRQSFVVELVGREDLPNAVSLNSATFNSARILGPAVAGVVINAWDTGPVFFANAASYVFVIANLLRMRDSELRKADRVERAPGQLREGLRYVLATPDLRYPILLVALIGMFGLNFQLTMALIAKETFGRGAASYGLLSTSLAIGSLAGALVAARRPKPRAAVWVGSAAVFGVLEAVVGLMPTYYSFAAMLVPTGFAILTFTTACNSSVQLAAAAHMRGRVMALYVLVFLGGTPVGAPIIGWVAEEYGVRWSLLIGGLVSALSAGWVGWALQRSRGRQRAEALVEWADDDGRAVVGAPAR